MKGVIIDRTGDIKLNNYGSEMKIYQYRTNKDMDIMFTKSKCIIYNVKYNDFKTGSIKSPYETRTFGIGYLGQGKYETVIDGKKSKAYSTWLGIMARCYNLKVKEGRPTYIGCSISDEWLNFQTFAEWHINNYYEIKDNKMNLDKDILNKGNKIYSKENCIFVPSNINCMFTKTDAKRRKYPIGVCQVSGRKTEGGYRASCCNGRKNKIYLGVYQTPEKAFDIYKEYKERTIKLVADEYKDRIPTKLYDALNSYIVEITD